MGTLPHDLGAYLREQRQHAQLTLRQLAEMAEVSNPYLSQIERGLKKPSAEILQSLAKGLRVSAESLYVRAGILEERDEQQVSIEAAILADPVLSERQKRVLLDIYESFRAESARAAAPRKPRTAKPTTVKPTTVKPTTVKPTTAKPTTAKPTSAKPSTVKPAASQATRRSPS